ncbi:biotin-dependent carboxyltransferase family protein [Formosa sp. S-31]|uniref:5-oxoprolinase subunit C family protein n=1 Tax=Formosa sp. S-31 TaxID=2790949 RepID=UPI003EB9FB7D
MIKVITPGFYSTIQDLGRFGFQEFGVPYSGVMDRQSAGIANGLLGNSKQDAVLEMTMTGATLQFLKDTLICISGADMGPTINGKIVKQNKAIAVKSDDVLSFGSLNKGFRCYLAVKGGFNSEVVLNSRSMYSRITEQVVLRKGDTLNIPDAEMKHPFNYAALKVKEDLFDTSGINVFKGPEFDMLSSRQQEQLLSKSFSISKDSNRMGYRLNEILENDLPSVLTSAVLPGTVQLTPSGQLIVLMRDCQTTGGYPRILQLSSEAINIMVQKYAGQSIRFYLELS